MNAENLLGIIDIATEELTETEVILKQSTKQSTKQTADLNMIFIFIYNKLYEFYIFIFLNILK